MKNFDGTKDGSLTQCRIYNGGTFNAKFSPDGRLAFLTLRNWKAAVDNPKRKLPFGCASQFSEILNYRATTKLYLEFDEEVSLRVPEILNSGLFDDAEIIDWNGVIVSNFVEDLFVALSKKSLKKLIFSAYKDEVGNFCIELRKKIPNLEIISVALNTKLRM